MFVAKADGSERKTTARAVVDAAWFGSRLTRTDKSRTDPFPYGICLLVSNTSFECERDVARDPTQDLINPAYSPDGRYVAVVKSPGTEIGAGPIVIYNAATATPVRQLVDGENSHPTWSPDGKQIAFGHGDDVWVAHATGAPRAHRVLRHAQQPAWTTAAACKARRPRVRVRGGSVLVTTCAPQPGRLTVTLLREGRRVRGRTVTAALRRPAGAGTLRPASA
jgi:dipeptidyl aminopeptidase/acylaminoacyl peptidase